MIWSSDSRCSVIQDSVDPSTWIMFYHAYARRATHGARSLMMDTLRFDAAGGWPRLTTGTGSPSTGPTPLPPVLAAMKMKSDDGGGDGGGGRGSGRGSGDGGGGGGRSSPAAATLPRHSVSGHSSGGDMAVMHGIILSSHVEGIGVASGAPYGCQVHAVCI